MSAQTLPHRQHQPDRGWGILEHGTIAIGTIIVLAIVGALVWSLWGKKSVAVEVSNLQTVVTNAQQLKQAQGGYNFTSGTTMTGTLIQQGAHQRLAGLSREQPVPVPLRCGTVMVVRSFWLLWHRMDLTMDFQLQRRKFRKQTASLSLHSSVPVEHSVLSPLTVLITVTVWSVQKRQAKPAHQTAE